MNSNKKNWKINSKWKIKMITLIKINWYIFRQKNKYKFLWKIFKSIKKGSKSIFLITM